MARATGRRRREDPWKARGWLTGGVAARVAGLVAALLAAVAVVGIWIAAEEWQFELYERDRYVVATGVVGPIASPDEVVVSAPEIGSVTISRWVFWEHPEPGDEVRIKLNPRDPRDYLNWEERARPWPATAVALGFAAASAAAVGVAAICVRRATHDPAHALDAAAPPMEPEAPPEVPVPARVTARPPRVGPAYLFGAVLGLAGILAFPTGITQPVYRTAAGTVVRDGDEHFVRYYDDAGKTTRYRPMTTVEERGRRDGDTFTVEYVYETGDGFLEVNPPNLYLGAGWVAVVAGRRWRWRRTLRALPRRRPEAVPLVGWVRVHLGTPWLALAPYDSTRVRDVVLVPLDHMAPAPDAVRSILRVRGRLRRGGAVLVHTREGEALWPVGRARGPVAAAVLGPSPWAPEPPRGGHAWFVEAGADVPQTGA